jgi:hypothetical protein
MFLDEYALSVGVGYHFSAFRGEKPDGREPLAIRLAFPKSR